MDVPDFGDKRRCVFKAVVQINKNVYMVFIDLEKT